MRVRVKSVFGFCFRKFFAPNKRPSHSAHSRSNLTKLRFVVLIFYSYHINFSLKVKINMEERGGFEPPVELLPHNLSKIAPSTARTSLQYFKFNINVVICIFLRLCVYNHKCYCFCSVM